MAGVRNEGIPNERRDAAYRRWRSVEGAVLGSGFDMPTSSAFDAGWRGGYAAAESDRDTDQPLDRIEAKVDELLRLHANPAGSIRLLRHDSGRFWLGEVPQPDARKGPMWTAEAYTADRGQFIGSGYTIGEALIALGQQIKANEIQSVTDIGRGY